MKIINLFQEKYRKLPNWLKIVYVITIHSMAAFAGFLILTTLAVQFKWTNDSGSVDVNNRYFEELADKYGKNLEKDSTQIRTAESIMFQKIAIIAEHYPENAKLIMEAYINDKNVYTPLRMIDAFTIKYKDNDAFIKSMNAVKSKTNDNKGSIYAWSNYKAWKQFCNALKSDKNAIDSVSRLTGVESRIIILCVVAEQLRMFNSGREKFKNFVYPYSRLILPTNRGYGVSGILEHTALRIEKTLFNRNDPFYPGDYFRNILNVRDSFPELKRDTIKSHRHTTIQRLIKGGDHYYSYLYTALLLRQFQSHWEKAGFSLSNRPEILGTLFNLGYQKSKPKKNPSTGGSSFRIGDKSYTFGGLCYEFYYSGELQKEFPITGKGFLSIAELEAKNKELVKSIKNKFTKDDEKEKKNKDKKPQIIEPVPNNNITIPDSTSNSRK